MVGRFADLLSLDEIASLVAGCEGSSVPAEITVGCCLYVEGFVLEAMTIVGGDRWKSGTYP